MGEAYEVIRQEEDYTEPSYKVRPPKRRKIYSDHQMQSVNLQQMNEQIDRMQEKERKSQKYKYNQRKSRKAGRDITEWEKCAYADAGTGVDRASKSAAGRTAYVGGAIFRDSNLS